jgi:hypothetical protein
MRRVLLCDVAALHSLRQMNHYIVFSIIWLAKYIIDIFSEQRVNSTVVVTEQNFLSTRSYKSSHCLIFFAQDLDFNETSNHWSSLRAHRKLNHFYLNHWFFCTWSRFQWVLVFSRSDHCFMLCSDLHFNDIGVRFEDWEARTGVLAYMIM